MKILHLHLEDGCKNAKTFLCILKNGSISYTMYGGHGSSGVGFAISNIQFYEMKNGRINWLRNASLPVENLANESLEEFKERVLSMLRYSTAKVVRVINTNVTFSE